MAEVALGPTSDEFPKRSGSLETRRSQLQRRPSFAPEVLSRCHRSDDQRLVGQEKIDEQAFTFGGEQGPWYTVGYKMAVIIEKRCGRRKLIDCMLDPRELLSYYNQAAKELNESGQEKLVLWSPELLRKIAGRSTGVKQ